MLAQDVSVEIRGPRHPIPGHGIQPVQERGRGIDKLIPDEVALDCGEQERIGALSRKGREEPFGVQGGTAKMVNRGEFQFGLVGGRFCEVT